MADLTEESSPRALCDITTGQLPYYSTLSLTTKELKCIDFFVVGLFSFIIRILRELMLDKLARLQFWSSFTSSSNEA